MALYNEEREGQSPKVTLGGGGNQLVDWQQQPSGFQQSSQMLSVIMSTLEQEEVERRKKETEKFDMFKTLREAGYDTKSAHAAMVSGKLPSAPPDTSMKERKEKAEVEKVEAETGLAKEKGAAYARGDIGGRMRAVDKMNAAQLQREIKRISNPMENPDFGSEESEQYLSYLNERLQSMAQYPGQGKKGAGKPQGGKIRVRRKADGQTGSILPQDFDPSKYERA